MIKITVWNEFLHEKSSEKVKSIYPDGIHKTIADFLKTENDMEVRCATLDDPSHGLSEGILANTDVLIWWGHTAHEKVSDEVVEMVCNRVLSGMGFIALHSAHYSKIFRKLMGTTCSLRWREAGEKERIWVIEPAHPIAAGLPDYFELEHEEMYGERFDIPGPETLVFAGWFKGGEVFRSGCCFTRGYGKIFYFQPGHETYPTFYNDNIQKVIRNAVRWSAQVKLREHLDCYHDQPHEPLD